MAKHVWYTNNLQNQLKLHVKSYDLNSSNNNNQKECFYKFNNENNGNNASIIRNNNHYNNNNNNISINNNNSNNNSHNGVRCNSASCQHYDYHFDRKMQKKEQQQQQTQKQYPEESYVTGKEETCNQVKQVNWAMNNHHCNDHDEDHHHSTSFYEYTSSNNNNTAYNNSILTTTRIASAAAAAAATTIATMTMIATVTKSSFNYRNQQKQQRQEEEEKHEQQCPHNRRHCVEKLSASTNVNNNKKNEQNNHMLCLNIKHYRNCKCTCSCTCAHNVNNCIDNKCTCLGNTNTSHLSLSTFNSSSNNNSNKYIKNNIESSSSGKAIRRQTNVYRSSSSIQQEQQLHCVQRNRNQKQNNHYHRYDHLVHLPVNVYQFLQNLISSIGFQMCCLLLLLKFTTTASGLAAVVDAATNMNLTDLGNPAPKYQTAYACEGKKLTIECESGDLINLIRANYGRFSITICNDHGNMEWSVNCMFPKSLTVLNSRCAHKQSCSVLATTNMFGDPCPGTHKYLEAHYQCISALQTSTTTNRPSPPPWILANNSPSLPNGSSSSIGSVLPPALQPALTSSLSSSDVLAKSREVLGSTISTGSPAIQTTLPGGRLKAGTNHTVLKSPLSRHDVTVGATTTTVTATRVTNHHHPYLEHSGSSIDGDRTLPTNYLPKAPPLPHHNSDLKNSNVGNVNDTTAPNSRILSGVGGIGSDDGVLLNGRGGSSSAILPVTTNTVITSHYHNNFSTGIMETLGAIITSGGGAIRTINNINNLNTALAIGGDSSRNEDESNLFCPPINARNLFWNITRVGDVNVQPCPGGATGTAKWRCVLMKRISADLDLDIDDDSDSLKSSITTTTTTSLSLFQCNDSSNCDNSIKMNLKLRNFEPTWHPLTPDLTQCRSLWLNNLEVRVNQPDSSLISIANDLSEVTSSKTLYGGDMLVTTKIIQTMSEKMYHDKQTFPDQRLREAMILELLQGVVKTGSNLLDESQLASWLDLNQEDQMRVATSLLTGLENNAFLLADTIIRERNVIQKVKNILLSVRVLETKNIQNIEVFPDAEQWQISDDRIELPRTALIENSEGGLVRIVFAAFDRLESILKPTYDHFDFKSARSYIRNTALLANDTDSHFPNSVSEQQQRIRILNSKVISASLGKGRHVQLSQPIRLILRHLKVDNVTNPTCVFWNYIDHAWSANGCILESTNRTHSICVCNHLTNFAILMDILDDHTNSLFTIFDGNMRILIYISVTICVIFIVIALLTLKIFNGVFIKSARTSIYRSIYICLLLIELLFLIGIEQTETSILCGFTTVFIHCTILTIIAWFCFEAFQSYTTLTTDDILLEVDQTSKVNCYYLLSYGLSFTIVAISLAIKPSTYTQNDYCVLMEANVLFYSTFVSPIVLFVMGALIYTFLSWIIMCRKCRSTLKNKEHTRLSSVRFDIRCSFTFLTLLCIAGLMAYWYLRYSKINDGVAQMYGYLYIIFNTFMGVYIFIFHCIQNEKIRREYRKYVRQKSWLPKCLRCSKASISSCAVGSSSCVMTATNGGGITATATVTDPINNEANLNMPNFNINSVNNSTKILHGKKSKMLNTDINDCDINKGTRRNSNNNSPTEDAVMISISSDCEFNELDMKTVHKLGDGKTIASSNTLSNCGLGGSINSALFSSTGAVQLKKEQSLLQNSVVLGYNVHNMAGGGSNGKSGTIRSNNGLRTPSVGHISPTSSVSSSHLMLSQNQCVGQKQTSQVQSATSEYQPESFYHQPEYYDWQQKAPKSSQIRDTHEPSGSNNGSIMGPSISVGNQQTHEFFYWTQKSNQSHSKKKRGNFAVSDSPSGSLHSQNTISSHSQQILLYPSYKKTTIKPQQQSPHQQKQYQTQHSHCAEANDAGTPVYYQQQHHEQQRCRLQPHQQYLQQQQLSSDEEQTQSAAHAHLLKQMNRFVCKREGEGVVPDLGKSSTDMQARQHNYYNRNKQSNCDLSQQKQQSLPIQAYDRHSVSDIVSGGAETYYNQGSLSSDNGPVYEEILSNRVSDIQHYNVDDMLQHQDYEDELSVHSPFRHRQQQQRLSQRGDVRSLHNYPDNGEFDMMNHNDENGSAYSDQDINDLNDNDENEVDIMYEDESDRDDNNVNGAHVRHYHHRRHHRKGKKNNHFRTQSNERVRHLISVQDADLQRKFHRHMRKNDTNVQETNFTASPSAYNEYHDTTNQYPSQERRQQPQKLTIFGINNGTGSSVCSFKKTTEGSVGSPPSTTGNRLAVNEIFNNGPPLPPANQHLLNKKSLSTQQQAQNQQQISPQSINTISNTPVGRNTSAMLDEHNTVRCYLEPLDK